MIRYIAVISLSVFCLVGCSNYFIRYFMIKSESAFKMYDGPIKKENEVCILSFDSDIDKIEIDGIAIDVHQNPYVAVLPGDHQLSTSYSGAKGYTYTGVGSGRFQCKSTIFFPVPGRRYSLKTRLIMKQAGLNYQPDCFWNYETSNNCPD